LEVEQRRGSSIPMAVLAVLIFWLAIIFVSFGLFAPPNLTVLAVLFVCVLSVSGAIFLILELDRPFEGLIRIPGAPLRDALMHLGQ
jgi:nitric oxide reductase large subunit